VFNDSLEYAGRYSFFAQTIQSGYDVTFVRRQSPWYTGRLN